MLHLKLLLMAPKRHWEDPDLVAWQFLFFYFFLGKKIVGFYKFDRHFNQKKKKNPLYVIKKKSLNWSNLIIVWEEGVCGFAYYYQLKENFNECSKGIDLRNIF